MKTFFLLLAALCLFAVPVAADDYEANDDEIKWSRIWLPAGKYTVMEKNNNPNAMAMLVALDLKKSKPQDCISQVSNPNGSLRKYMPKMYDSGRAVGIYTYSSKIYSITSTFEVSKRCKIRYKFMYDWLQELADIYNTTKERASTFPSFQLQYVFRRLGDASG